MAGFRSRRMSLGVTALLLGVTSCVAVQGAHAASATMLIEPAAGYGPVYAFIASAKQSLDMSMYELSDAKADDALAADATRGVVVRVLLDRAYIGARVNATAFMYLKAHGVRVRWSNGSEIFHQKTITVNGARSWISTGNLTSEYYATSRDIGIFDSNQTDVGAIVATFNQDFAGGIPRVASSGSGDLVWSPGSQQSLVSLIATATTSVQVENEEMDSYPIETALEAAARRGVNVQVTMTQDPAWDKALSSLVAAGVQVSLYAASATLYIHAKVIVIDGSAAFVGSENFSTASLEYDRELGVLVTNQGDVTELRAT